MSLVTCVSVIIFIHSTERKHEPAAGLRAQHCQHHGHTADTGIDGGVEIKKKESRFAKRKKRYIQRQRRKTNSSKPKEKKRTKEKNTKVWKAGKKTKRRILNE